MEFLRRLLLFQLVDIVVQGYPLAPVKAFKDHAHDLPATGERLAPDGARQHGDLAFEFDGEFTVLSGVFQNQPGSALTDVDGLPGLHPITLALADIANVQYSAQPWRTAPVAQVAFQVFFHIVSSTLEVLL